MEGQRGNNFPRSQRFGPVVRRDLRDPGGLTLCARAPRATVKARAPQEGKAREKGSYPPHSSPLPAPCDRHNNGHPETSKS